MTEAATMVMEPVISLRRATASLGSRPVLRGIDLTVGRGEVVALLGANGSGKSTAVRAVVGQVPLSGGELELFGTPLRRFRDWARIGYVPQRTTAASGVPATVREVVSAGRLARTRLGFARKGTAPRWTGHWTWSAWATGPATRSTRCPAASTSGC